MDGFIEVTARIVPGELDEGGFVAFSPELGVASQGESLDEALTNIQEAIVTFITTMDEMGDLEDFLRERNITVSKVRPQSPTRVDLSPGETVAAFVASVSRGHLAIA